MDSNLVPEHPRRCPVSSWQAAAPSLAVVGGGGGYAYVAAEEEVAGFVREDGLESRSEGTVRLLCYEGEVEGGEAYVKALGEVGELRLEP